MLDQVYEFDFGNKIKKILSYLFEIFYNFSICGFAFISTFLIGVYLSNNNILGSRILTSILCIALCLICIGVWVFYIILFIKSKSRKIILSDQMIAVKRNAMPHYYISRGVNDYILYSSIEYCKLCELHDRLVREFPFILFNWDSVVEIKDKYNKEYFIPVKNASMFIEEVNKRVALAQKTNIEGTSASQ